MVQGADISPGLEDASNLLNDYALRELDKEMAAGAADLEIKLANEISAALYDPETGYLNTRRGGAVEAREALDERLGEIEAKVFEGVPSGVVERVSKVAQTRIMRAR